MISVFGGTGFIGSRFCQLYQDKTIKVHREHRGCKTSEALYLISTVHNYNIFDDPYLDIHTNLHVLIDTLEEFRKNNKEKNKVFNFVSSWFVYGKNTTLPAREQENCDPRGFYSITKRTAEQLLISYCETYKIDYRIFRLANVYGNGDRKTSKKKNALQYMIDEIANNRSIDLYEGGSHLRDFIYVDDACRAIDLCIKNSLPNQIINIGTGTPTSILDAMLYVKKSLNSTSKFNTIDTPEFHKLVQIENMYLDVSKLKSLNFEPLYDIKKGLNQILKGYKNEQ